MSTAFSRPYARAFVEAAPKDYDFGAFLEAGESMARALESNPKLRAFLLAPNVPREAKNKAIRQIGAKTGMNEYGTRFLLVMLRHHRLLQAGDVFHALRDLIDAVQGVLRVRVTVAGPLTDAEKKAIQDALAARTGKTVKMQIDLDPTLIGGFVARAGSRVFDGSVTAAIRQFKTRISQTLGA
ncbi:MAG TPA: ATP synthase F1 subunit delta [Thermoanaerobaculia bacterium]|jgi:F-type H+-transporting ATPase subunit delta